MLQREGCDSEELAITLHVCLRTERKVSVMVPGADISSGPGHAMPAAWGSRFLQAREKDQGTWTNAYVRRSRLHYYWCLVVAKLTLAVATFVSLVR